MKNWIKYTLALIWAFYSLIVQELIENPTDELLWNAFWAWGIFFILATFILLGINEE